MANVQVIKSTGNITAAQLQIDMQDIIYQIDDDKGNRSPLTVLSARMAKKPAKEPKFSWLEDEMVSRWDAVNLATGYTDGATDIIVDTGALFRAGDMVKVPRTGEVMSVTSISTNTLTVVRSAGDASGTAAAALVNDDPLVIIGNANEEAASTRAILSSLPSEVYNYTQIIRTPFGVSKTLQASDTYGGGSLDYERRKHALEHRVDIERALLFGERNLITTGTHYKRYTGGFLYYVTTNLKDAGGTLTEAEFEDWLEDIFAYGSSRKVLFASPKLISALDYWAKSKLNMFPKDKTYGIAASQYLSSHGELIVVKHHLLEGTTYGGYGLAVDMDYIKFRPLQTRDTVLSTNIQTPGADQIIDEYLTEVGLELNAEKAHGILYGVTSYS